MPTVTEQTLTVHDLYAMRDNVGLPKQECIAPVKKRSWFEWDKFEQAHYIKKNRSRQCRASQDIYL